MKFNSYYKNHGWKNPESVSGHGSSMIGTEEIRQALPVIFKDYQIKTFLDIPCGDFFWMNKIDLKGIHYTGADIVADLIKENHKRYTTSHIQFKQADIIKDKVAKYDLIMTRDCFIHLTFKMIQKALHNLKSSGSTYFMSTTFPALTTNQEIYSAGLFRPINLQLPPFNFPDPLLLVDEKRKDRHMGLWKISDIPNYNL